MSIMIVSLQTSEVDDTEEIRLILITSTTLVLCSTNTLVIDKLFFRQETLRSDLYKLNNLLCYNLLYTIINVRR